MGRNAEITVSYETRQRIRKYAARFHTMQEIADKIGMSYATVQHQCFEHRIPVRKLSTGSGLYPVPTRGTVDNALKAAFRKVVGFCPVHDGAPREQVKVERAA